MREVYYIDHTGGLDDVTLLITTNSDVIFKLQLPSTILVPVQLYICYIDARNPEIAVGRLTSTSYNNTAQITHFEPSARVPSNELPRVRVMVALQHQDMQGPNTTSALEYGQRNASMRVSVLLMHTHTLPYMIECS